MGATGNLLLNVQFFDELVLSGQASIGRRFARLAIRAWHMARTNGMKGYVAPNRDELCQIENDLVRMGIRVDPFVLDVQDFEKFSQEFRFPADYHGGAGTAIYVEKVLEHYVAWKLLELESDARQPYIDVAACASPWAKLLRDAGYESFAIDLAPNEAYSDLPYYEEQDATRTRFLSESIGSASLQCAFEMFSGPQDTQLIHELARVLKPGGRALIAPLYMHTHACYYQSPEFAGRVEGDVGATGYIRRGCWGVPSSRKYSYATLLERVWRPSQEVGLFPEIKVIRNAGDIHPNAYLHFVLVLSKANQLSEAA